jgi:predicted SnoaL-like aldol condensation-catalyzing enzyme
MMTAGQRECATFQDKLARAAATSTKIPKVGDVIEVPTMATVDGEMVTMYGAGVDIFQVHDDRIVAHWDGSPPVPIVIKAHPQGMVENMMKVIAGDPTAHIPGTRPGGTPPKL